MKFCYPEIDYVFDTEVMQVNSIVIEHPLLFRHLLEDIQLQVDGNEGQAVLSEDNQPVRMDKRAVLLDRFVPFSLNQKAVLAKIVSTMEEKATEGDNYLQTAEVLSHVQRVLCRLSADLVGDIDFENISMTSLIKACGVKVCDDYDSLAEKIVDYMELVNEYLGEKLFFTVNLRSYLSDEEAELFLQTIIQHGFHCILIESCEKTRLPSERRFLIDDNLCEIL